MTRRAPAWVAWLAVPYETAIDQWDGGLSRLARRRADAAPGARAGDARRSRPSCAGASAARSPPTSSSTLYDQGTDWCVEPRGRPSRPSDPYAWDMRVVADAAFARYLRSAVDFAGGRRHLAHPRPRGRAG